MLWVQLTTLANTNLILVLFLRECTGHSQLLLLLLLGKGTCDQILELRHQVWFLFFDLAGWGWLDKFGLFYGLQTLLCFTGYSLVLGY